MGSEANTPIDGWVEVSISSDGMIAEMTIHDPQAGGNPVTVEQALQALQKSGVVAGVDESRVAEALQPDKVGTTVEVARGIAPQEGTDGRIEYKFPINNGPPTPVELPDGRVDYHNLDLVHNVNKGDVLVLRIPPVPGEPGTTVMGQKIPPKPVKDIHFFGGKNTAKDETGDRLVATTDGYVELVDSRVIVQILYEVKGDVCFATGNINCLGNVLVRGDIRTGFEVKASGNIEVHGMIEAASVSAGGNIVAKTGIAGAWKARIKAGKNIVARFVENAELEAGGSVIINDCILNAEVTAGQAVRVEGRRGTICGGVIQAAEEIIARTLGSPQGTKTVVEVGVNPKLREDYMQLSKMLREKKQQLETMEKQAVSNKQFIEDHPDLSKARKAFLEEQIKNTADLQLEVEELKPKVQGLDEEINRLSRGRVKVLGIAHTGVRITVVRASLEIEQPIRGTIFSLDRGDIVTHPLR